MAYFLVASSGHAAPLAARTTFVGSDPQVDVPIHVSLGLAPRHFVVVQQENGHCLQALTVDSPVMVNGLPVQFQELRVGDWIQAGQLALCYQSDTPVAPPSEPLPTMDAARWVEPPPIPPTAPSENDEPRSGYRRPDSPRPLDLDSENETGAMSIAGLPTLARSMAATDRARAYVEEQKSSQSMTGAVFAGVLTALAISIVWGISSILPTIFFMGTVGGLGYVVGCAVRMGGKGFDLKFGYTGALCALLAGMTANYARVAAVNAAAHMAAPAISAADVDPDAGMQSSLRESMSDLGIDPDDPDLPEKNEPAGGGGSVLVLLLFLFSPRALISYGIAMGAAYKSSFRTLTADEAARMQYG